MKKQLSELSDSGLEKAEDRTEQKYYEIIKEQSRRKLIERYGADNPELNTYSVWVTVEGAFDVKARSEEEAAQIIEGNFDDGYGVWLVRLNPSTDQSFGLIRSNKTNSKTLPIKSQQDNRQDKKSPAGAD